MPSVCARWFIGIALFLGAGIAGAQPKTINLANSIVDVSINPTSLETTVSKWSGQNFKVSLPIGPPCLAMLLDVQEEQASWVMPEYRLRCSAHLSSDSLVLEIKPDRDGITTWPVIAASPTCQGWMIPRSEGSYVPASDKDWIEFLSDQGPFDTTADLSMPFLGLDFGSESLTYIFANQFNNKITFDSEGGRLRASVTHDSPVGKPRKAYTVIITPGKASPVEPALVYRRWLQAKGEFVTLAEKMTSTPATALLPGAAHIYLWGSGTLGAGDILDWRAFCKDLQSSGPVASQIRNKLSAEAQKASADLIKLDYPDHYLKSVIVADLNRALRKADFLTTELVGVPDSNPVAKMAMEECFAGMKPPERILLRARFLAAAFPGRFEAVDRWGDGYSVSMMDKLSSAGLDRLWLGFDSLEASLQHPAAVARARELGYLVGPYDSYASIHSPKAGADQTWESAQFDEELYRNGPIVRADGTKMHGFKKVGYRLSTIAARPYVESRVSQAMKGAPFNSWFMDCDAFGDFLDDYSTSHPATQLDDMNARLSRMAWIRDRFGAVVGSEGGSGFSAPVIAFAHGMTTPVIGWGDEDLKDRKSPYFLGAYYPPDGPAVFLKKVPLKPYYEKFHFDPRYRLPLYETVFHDSVVATHHWSAASLKFSDQATTVALLECLYQTPPMYHLNQREWGSQQKRILDYYRFWSPLHRETATLPMSAFRWMTPDRRVQFTRFGADIEVVANFGAEAYTWDSTVMASGTVAVRNLKTGKVETYLPPVEKPKAAATTKVN